MIPTNPDDRLMAAFREIVRTETVSLRLQYADDFDYTITAVYGHAKDLDVTVDCTPNDTSLGLPVLAKVTMQYGLGGIAGDPNVGEKCVVIFLNRDPTKPRVRWWASIGNTPVARVGDQVNVSMPRQIQMVGTVLVTDPFNGYLQLLDTNVTGFITSGSKKDFSG